jgi:hypothetical protein
MAKGLSYYIPPELREFGKGAYELAKTIRPFQGEDLPVYDSNKSFGKNILDMATGVGSLALDFGTLGLGSAPQKIALKVAEEAAKSGTKTGVRSVDNIINQKIVPKVNEKIDLNDIYINPLKRKDRVKLRNEAVNNKDLNNLANQIKKESNLSARGKNRYSEDTISKFIKIYNSGNPFKIEQLRSMTPDQFKSILRKVGPKGTNKINQETIDSNLKLLNSKIENITDVRVGKLEEQLRKYKGSNPKETGINLKVNKFGEFDIDDIFKLDDDLKVLINNKSAKQKILKKLEKEGILDELGLTDINRIGKPKIISEPQIDQYLKDLNLNYLPKKFDFTSKILNPKQKEIYSNLQNKVTKSMGGSDKAVYDIIRDNVNRMIKYGVRDKGKSIDEVMTSLQKQIDDPEFLTEVVPLIQKKVKTQNYIKGIKKDLGVDLDSVDLSHMTAVVDDIDQTFKLNNLFIGLSKKNAAESVIQKKIKNLNKQLDEKGGSVANKNKIKADIEDLQYELKTGDYYDAVSENYPSTSDVGVDVQKQIKEKISEAMMGEPTYFKKDGGMVGIRHLIRPL